MRLHVVHSWGGGLAKWARDFCQADEADGAAVDLILQSVGTRGAYGQRLELRSSRSGAEPLEFWELNLPIHATALLHLQYRSILMQIVQDHGVGEVVVSSLIGHSLDALRTGLPTVIVAHDHYPFCVALYASFEGECRRCDAQRLRECMVRNPGHSFFEGVQAEDWLALRHEYVRTIGLHRPLIVAPTPSTARRWQSLMPDLPAERMRVVAHGCDLPPPQDFSPAENGRLRLVMIGRLTAAKGRELLERSLPLIEPFAELVLLGCGRLEGSLAGHPQVVAVPDFEHGELARLMAEHRPHLGLLLSTVPETFSYAMSELHHHGLPVVACAIGAALDRIGEGVNGRLVAAEPAEVARVLAELHADRQAIARMREAVRTQEPRSLAAMIRDHRALLKELAGEHGANWPAAESAVRLTRMARAPQRRRPAIHVSPEATWAEVASAFVRYTGRKAAHSPRVPAWLRQRLLRHFD